MFYPRLSNILKTIFLFPVYFLKNILYTRTSMEIYYGFRVSMTFIFVYTSEIMVRDHQKYYYISGGVYFTNPKPYACYSKIIIF